MKNILTIVTVMLISLSISAQSPQKMSYQAIIRDANSQLVTSKEINVRLSVLQGAPGGTPVYIETFTPETNANGLISVEIGGDHGFDTINWANGPFFLQTETDPSGGTNYSIVGTSQLLSVPYALYAETSGDTTIWKPENNNIYYNSGKVGIGTSNPGSKLELIDKNAPAEMTIYGQGLSFATSALVFKVATDEADRRGSGIFLYDSLGRTEWFTGRPYGNYLGSTSDRFVIQRNPNDSIHSLRAAGLIDGEGQPTGTERFFSVESNGFIGIGTNDETPKSRLQVANGDVYLSDIESGIIIKSPNGQCWKLTVNNNGNFLSSPVECP